MAPLNQLVERIRTDGTSTDVPYFDPADGGIHARCLFVLEAPGPNAVKSGFVSRDNPDETAKNLYLLTQAAGLPRDITAIWNIVPWYIGTEGKIRPARRSDIAAGVVYLKSVCELIPNLRTIVLVGQKAQTVAGDIAIVVPDVEILRSPHPSPLFINNKPGNRALVLKAFETVRKSLGKIAPPDA